MSKVVWIKCKQVVEFSQQHTITDDEYEILKDLDMDDIQENYERNSQYSIISGYLSYNDILDSEPEFTNVSIELDEEDTPKKKVKKAK